MALVVVALVSACTAGAASLAPASPSASASASPSPATATSAAPSGSGVQAPTKLVVGLGYIPSVQFAQFYLAQQKGYYAEAGLSIEFQNKIDLDLIPLVGQGHDRHRDRRRDERHPGGQQRHPDPVRGDDLRQVPEHRVRQGIVGDQDGGRPQGQEDRHARAGTARAGSCSRHCSDRPA